jgi:hypothetical protein
MLLLTRSSPRTYVKSPVASLIFDCSSVRNRVRVMMSVLIASLFCELEDMLRMCDGYQRTETDECAMGTRGGKEGDEEMRGIVRKRAARGIGETSHDGIGMSRSPVYEVRAGSEWIESGLRSTVRYSFAHEMHRLDAALGNVTGLTMLQPQKLATNPCCAWIACSAPDACPAQENTVCHAEIAVLIARRSASFALWRQLSKIAMMHVRVFRGAAVAGLFPHFSSPSSSPASSDPRM